MRLSTLLRVAFAAIVTFWMVQKADPGRVGAALQDVRWSWIAAAVALVLVDRGLMAYRWLALLAPLSSANRPPFRRVLRIFFVSTFVGSFLPNIGGDAVRTWSLARDGVPASQSLASVLLDRLLGVVSIVIAAAAGLLLTPDLLGEGVVRWALALALAGSAAGAALIFSATLDNLLRAFTARLAEGRLRRSADRVLDALRAYDRQRRALVLVLIASLGVQALRILQAWLLGRSLGIDASAGTYFAFIPIILLVMQVPVTVSGLGVAQWAFEVMFQRVGVASAPAVALSLLFIALGVVGNLPGGFLYVAGRERAT